MRKLLTIITLLTAIVIPANATAATPQATATASAVVVHVGESVTFNSTTPCTAACSQTWTWYNGVNRLGYHMGYGSQVNYKFTTPRSGPVQLALYQPSYPGSRLGRTTYAEIYVTVLP